MEIARSEQQAQVVYLSHGGGPLPILGDAGHAAMIEFMHKLGTQLRRPDVILVVSAHWEERVATVQGSAAPRMFYDYYGFPAAAYDIVYPAPGSADTAARIVEMLSACGLPGGVDRERGFDHGLFIPLKMMFPQADIPALQLSLLSSLDAQSHLQLGEALSGLMAENILVVGSGFSFHNLGAFDWRGRDAPDPHNDAFQDWLIEVCSGAATWPERKRRLVEWQTAPSARYCHPREEHLLPLHVCMGMARRPAEVAFDDSIFGKRSVAFRWS